MGAAMSMFPSSRSAESRFRSGASCSLARRVRRYSAGVPVYFDEAVCRRPDRVLLENVRRGEFEGLSAAALKDLDPPARHRRSRIHPTAGASAVGARQASRYRYNVTLRLARRRRRRARTNRCEGGAPRAADSMASRRWEQWSTATCSASMNVSTSPGRLGVARVHAAVAGALRVTAV